MNQLHLPVNLKICLWNIKWSEDLHIICISGCEPPNYIIQDLVFYVLLDLVILLNTESSDLVGHLPFLGGGAAGGMPSSLWGSYFPNQGPGSESAKS